MKLDWPNFWMGLIALLVLVGAGVGAVYAFTHQ